MKIYLAKLIKQPILLIFSFFFALCCIFSYIYTAQGGIQNVTRLLITILLALILTFPLTSLFQIIINWSIPTRKLNLNKKAIIFRFLLYVLVIFLCQLPVFLAFYPGICTFDIREQLIQYNTPYFIKNHPLLHTLFLGFCYNLFSNREHSMAVYTIFQMLILDSAIGYALLHMYKKGCPKIFLYISLLFWGLFPVNSLFSISTTKDIIFSALFLFLTIYYLEHADQKNFSFIVLLLLSLITVLLIMFRNNTFYAFIVSGIIVLLLKLIKKSSIKKYLIYMILTIALFRISDFTLTHVTNASNGSIKEMMSIPSQEMARIYISVDDTTVKEEIKKYIPEPGNYCYWLSDAIKQQLDSDDLDSLAKHFLLQTAIYNFKYPIVCLDAILYNTQGYWDIFHSPYQEIHSYVASIDYRADITLQSYLPSLMQVYFDNFETLEQYKGTIWMIFLGIGLYIWIFLLSLVKAIHGHKSYIIIGALFPLFYLLTLLLGPGAITRYAYPFILIAPVFIYESWRR